MNNPKPNLFKGEQNAIEELAKRKDIIITNSDKGSAVVIMEVEKYINEANRQLSYKCNYKKLQEDPMQKYSNLVNNLKNWLADWNLSTDKPQGFHPRYIKKKKKTGRPVINSINCHASEISRFVDHHLQRLAREIPLYIKDTNDFINEINNFAVPPNSSHYVFLITKGLLS